MHLGLIGGIGPAATVFYYERIVRAFAAAAQPLQLTIGHTSALELSRNVAAGRADVQAIEFARVAEQLKRAGADRVVITSMGGHFCAAEFAKRSPLPMINGPESVAAELKKQGIKRIGILGTRIVMQTQLYAALRDLDPIAPEEPLLGQVDHDYVGMAVAGWATEEQTERLIAAGEHLMRKQGAQAVLLGGTDLNMVFKHHSIRYPVIDSAALHVDAVVAAALAG